MNPPESYPLFFEKCLNMIFTVPISPAHALCTEKRKSELAAMNAEQEKLAAIKATEQAKKAADKDAVVNDATKRLSELNFEFSFGGDAQV